VNGRPLLHALPTASPNSSANMVGDEGTDTSVLGPGGYHPGPQRAPLAGRHRNLCEMVRAVNNVQRVLCRGPVNTAPAPLGWPSELGAAFGSEPEINNASR
jgi:hypothetical protein